MFTFVHPCTTLHVGLETSKQTVGTFENKVQSQMSMRDDASDKLTPGNTSSQKGPVCKYGNKTVPLFMHPTSPRDSWIFFFFKTIFQVFSHYLYGLI